MEPKKEIANKKEYTDWIRSLKSKFRQSQLKAAVSVNHELLAFYWDLGHDIIEKQKRTMWGEGFIAHLSHDLLLEFPETRGFTERNLKFIRKWVLFWMSDNRPIGKQAVSLLDRYRTTKTPHLPVNETAPSSANFPSFLMIPWGHNIKIVSKCKDRDEALFYVKKTIEHGWSRSILEHYLESKLYEREGKAITNFSDTLPPAESDIAKKMLKDPYIFDFISQTTQINEREFEKTLVDHITKFLLELGAGFAYVGKQVPLEVGGDNFFVDLLFYHTKLHCYVVLELKAGNFKPEYAGKLNFYLKAVDELVRTKPDNKTIGVLLCKDKNNIVAQYALSDIHKPIGVSKYESTHQTPQEILANLPTIAQFEEEIGGSNPNSN
jgi:predicted nuclease of restriction endonuclease-like (RecB) superfamily